MRRALKHIPAFPIYICVLGWAAWYFYTGATGGLGPDPAKVIEHQYGRVALYLLLGALAITPMRRYIGINLFKYRRAMGVSAGLLTLFHVAVWLVLDMQDIGKAIEEALKRRHLIFGLVAALLMMPLLLTSNHMSVRRLGRIWNHLHKLAYAILPLAAIHYLLANKTIETEAALLLGIAILWLVLRADFHKLRKPQVKT